MRNAIVAPSTTVKTRLGIVLAAVLLVFAAAPPVQAAHLACGDVLTTDTALDSDLFCVGGALVVGADGITIDLNGHSIVRVGNTGFPNGIHNQGFDDVTISNGSIIGFQNGVSVFGVQGNLVTELQISNSTFSGVNVLRGNSGLSSSRNEISNLTMTSNARGVVLQGGAYDNVVAHNSIDGTSLFGIQLFRAGEANQIRDNSISGSSDYGIALFLGSDGNEVNRNTVEGASEFGLFIENSDNNEISNNDISLPNGHGVIVKASDTNSLTNNRAVGGGVGWAGFGLTDHSSGNFLSDNEATSFHVGFSVKPGSNNTLLNNTAKTGIVGFTVEESGGNHLQGNHAQGFAIGFFLWHTSGNTLHANSATDNIEKGFALNDAPRNTLKENVATRNSGIGFSLYSGSSDNTLEENFSRHNDGHGIEMVLNSNNNLLKENLARNNGGFDLVEADLSSSPNTYIENDFKTTSTFS